jgi:HK97 family phage prohead protease
MKEKNKNSLIEYKSQDIPEERYPQISSRKVTGYFAAFNIVDSDMDIIRPGAFVKSIQERGPASLGNRKIKFLHQHNVNEPTGRVDQLFEDGFGLGFEAEIEKTALGDIILERYKNGIYREHSIGFKYIWEKCEWIKMPIEGALDSMAEVFECKEINLFEGSVVTFGANSHTPFTGFKGNIEDLQKMLNSELEYLIRKADNYDFELQIRNLWAKQISLVQQLAVENTKQLSKPIESKWIDVDFIINNLKF